MIVMGKIGKQGQKQLAIWAADCAKRALPFFRKAYPKDRRPQKAIDACREWARTGVFRMAVIRKASLDAHAAARRAIGNGPASFAARAAGQAVATAHVPEHAYGAAYYAVKAVAAANPANANRNLMKESKWQLMHLPRRLRNGWLDWQKRRLPKSHKMAMRGWRGG